MSRVDVVSAHSFSSFFQLVVLATFITNLVVALPVSLQTVINPEGEAIIPLRTQPVFRLIGADGRPKAHPGTTITLTLVYSNPPAEIQGQFQQLSAGPDFIFSGIRISSAGIFQIKASAVLSATVTLETTTDKFELRPPLPTKIVAVQSPALERAGVPFDTAPIFQLLNKDDVPVPFSVSCSLQLLTAPPDAVLLGETTVFPKAPPDSYPDGALFEFHGITASVPGDYQLRGTVKLLGQTAQSTTSPFVVQTATTTVTPTPYITLSPQQQQQDVLPIDETESVEKTGDTTNKDAPAESPSPLHQNPDDLVDALDQYHILVVHFHSVGSGSNHLTFIKSRTSLAAQQQSNGGGDDVICKVNIDGDAVYAFPTNNWNSHTIQTLLLEICVSPQVGIVRYGQRVCVNHKDYNTQPTRLGIAPSLLQHDTQAPTTPQNSVKQDQSQQQQEKQEPIEEEDEGGEFTRRDIIVLSVGIGGFSMAVVLSIISFFCFTKKWNCVSREKKRQGINIADFVDQSIQQHLPVAITPNKTPNNTSTAVIPPSLQPPLGAISQQPSPINLLSPPPVNRYTSNIINTSTSTINNPHEKDSSSLYSPTTSAVYNHQNTNSGGKLSAIAGTPPPHGTHSTAFRSPNTGASSSGILPELTRTPPSFAANAVGAAGMQLD